MVIRPKLLHLDDSYGTLVPGHTDEENAECFEESEEQEVFSEIVSPRNIREAAPMQSYQHGL